MASIPWYNVLFNYQYTQAFAYIPVDVNNRDEYIMNEDQDDNKFYE